MVSNPHGAHLNVLLMRLFIYILLAICVAGTIARLLSGQYVEAVAGMWLVVFIVLMLWIERRERDEQ